MTLRVVALVSLFLVSVNSYTYNFPRAQRSINPRQNLLQVLVLDEEAYSLLQLVLDKRKRQNQFFRRQSFDHPLKINLYREEQDIPVLVAVPKKNLLRDLKLKVVSEKLADNRRRSLSRMSPISNALMDMMVSPISPSPLPPVNPLRRPIIHARHRAPLIEDSYADYLDRSMYNDSPKPIEPIERLDFGDELSMQVPVLFERPAGQQQDMMIPESSEPEPDQVRRPRPVYFDDRKKKK